MSKSVDKESTDFFAFNYCVPPVFILLHHSLAAIIQYKRLWVILRIAATKRPHKNPKLRHEGNLIAKIADI